VYEDRSQSGLRNLVFAQSVLLIALAGLMIYLTWPRWGPGLDPNATSRLVAARGDLAADEQATIELFKKSSPSVVHITTLVERQGMFDLNVTEIPRGTGTGFLWDDEGRIVTNYHVVQESDSLQVTLSDGSNWRGRVVGAFPDRDIAVVAIDVPKVKGLRAIPIGSSEDLQVGQKVFAIGNPFGLDQSLTTGVISALGREIESVTRRPISGVIQTDAAINPGNSGGPLLDSAGRLIGMNTAIFSRSGAWSGVGFAIPVDTINEIVPQLIRHGKIARAGLGITPAPDQASEELGIDGVLIINVQPGGPAQKAGLQPTRRNRRGQIILGDVITKIDNKPVKKLKDLLGTLAAKKVGDTVTLEILRDDDRSEVTVTLEATG
jgi:S1-C subfamily serine protease